MDSMSIWNTLSFPIYRSSHRYCRLTPTVFFFLYLQNQVPGSQFAFCDQVLPTISVTTIPPTTSVVWVWLPWAGFQCDFQLIISFHHLPFDLDVYLQTLSPLVHSRLHRKAHRWMRSRILFPKPLLHLVVRQTLTRHRSKSGFKHHSISTHGFAANCPHYLRIRIHTAEFATRKLLYPFFSTIWCCPWKISRAIHDKSSVQDRENMNFPCD